jgi:carbonic anhydrase/acetyltransferase-like protein (isoleucine patch superfamily)
MNAVILDNAELEEECIVGALALIKEGEKFSRRSLVVGNPAKKIKEVSDEMIAWKKEGTALYQALPEECFASLKPCDPLRKIPADRSVQLKTYQPFKRK